MTDAEREELDQEPVWYCKECLSLKIISLGDDQCFCDMCGGVDVAQATIGEWNELYENKYKHKFIENGRKSRYVWSTDRRES